jgi:hypothetical protein
MSGERLEVELIMPRSFRFSRTLFSCQTFLFIFPSLRFIFLLITTTMNKGMKKKKTIELLVSVSAQAFRLG